MLYELHISVEERPTIDDAVRFSTVCEEMLGKPLLLQLSNGESPAQLMMTRRSEFSDTFSDDTAIAWATTQAEMIQLQGWNVVRVKVEAPFAAKTYGPPLMSAYSEAHYKMYLNSAEVADLEEFLEQHPEFMYKHSWSVMEPGVNYLTVRSTEADLFEVFSLFTDRGERLTMAGFRPDKFHYERVLYDSNPGLDAGWSR